MSKNIQILSEVAQKLEVAYQGAKSKKVWYQKDGDVNSTLHLYSVSIVMPNNAIIEIRINTTFIPYGRCEYKIEALLTKGSKTQSSRIMVERNDISVQTIVELLRSKGMKKL